MTAPFRPTLALAAAIAALAALSAWTVAQPGVTPTGPLKIAIVDLTRMGAETNGLLEAADINARLRAEIEALNRRLEEVATQFTSAQKELQNFSEKDRTSREYMQKLATALELEVQTKTRKQTLERIFEQQKAVVTADMYNKMQAGIAEFARQEGYDLVLIDDRTTPVTAERGPEALAMAMQSKRVMFATPRVDITDQVIQFMNLRYKAAVPTPGASAPAPAGGPSVTGPTIAPTGR